MAIEVIPKTGVKRTGITDYILYFSITLLVAAGIGWLVLPRILKNYNDKLGEIQNSIENEISQKRDLENKVLSFKEKLEDFSSVLDSHKMPSKFFEFLQPITHPKVSFFDLELNTDQSIVSLSGKTDSFQSLGQQISALQNQAKIYGLRIKEISMAKEGGIEFKITFSIDKEFLLIGK